MQPCTIITGAASGLGLATARHLARQGHNLVLVDRSVDSLNKAVQELEPLSSVMACPGSVSDEEQVKATIASALDTYGSIQNLVTSAGIVQVTPAFELEAQAFRDHLEVNVTGSWLYAQAAGREMAKNKGGNIVMIGSVYGAGGAAKRTAYCASKGAVHNLVRSLAVEWGHLGIRVNAVAPTGVRTPMVQDLIDRGLYNLKGVQARTPLARLAEPEEVADAIAFLISEQAKMITGHILPVDGGWLAHGYIVENDQ